MKLRSLIDEKYGLPGNAGRDFGEKFMRDFIGSGNFAELWTTFEATYPEIQPILAKTFEKTNDLLRYIKPEKGDETYRVSSIDEPVAQELDNYLDNILAATDELSNLDEIPDQKTVSDAIQYFDGLLQGMLDLFTSNTAGDEPLEPYQQTKIGFGSSQYNEGQITKKFIKKSLNEEFSHNPNIDYTEFFKKIIDKLGIMDYNNQKSIENLQKSNDLNLDYIASSLTGEDPSSLSSDQSRGYYSTPKVKKDVGEQIREVIKREIKSLKNSQ